MNEVNEMSKMNQVQDDEIDLFELFQTLWDGKWLISAFVVLATLIGFGYSQVAQPKYDVSVPYTSSIYSVSAQQICDGNIDCIETEAIKRFLSLLGNSWSKRKKSSTLSFSTSAPLEQNQYDVQIQQANKALTNEVYLEAKTELSLIQTELTGALLGTEIVATNMLNAKRIIQSIDSGQSVISFGSASVVKSSPKVPLILALSVVLGGIVGVFFILVRNAITKRKEQLVKV
jgi:LPS O-antigen subunit length determinant protein (WzzB/FepE family)